MDRPDVLTVSPLTEYVEGSPEEQIPEKPKGLQVVSFPGPPYINDLYWALRDPNKPMPPGFFGPTEPKTPKVSE